MTDAEKQAVLNHLGNLAQLTVNYDGLKTLIESRIQTLVDQHAYTITEPVTVQELTQIWQTIDLSHYFLHYQMQQVYPAHITDLKNQIKNVILNSVNPETVFHPNMKAIYVPAYTLWNTGVIEGFVLANPIYQRSFQKGWSNPTVRVQKI